MNPDLQPIVVFVGELVVAFLVIKYAVVGGLKYHYKKTKPDRDRLEYLLQRLDMKK